MSISIGEAVSDGAAKLARAGIAEARLESTLLLAHALGRDRTFMITHMSDPIEIERLQLFRELIERRAHREPLQYLTGHQEFFKLDFEVTRDVLIPRPETELLVEGSLELLRDSTAPLIADIGTGSGCIAISLLRELPDARAIATDISPAALRTAKRNAERHGVADRLTLVESDLVAQMTRGARFSLIVSNPPYVREDEWATLQPEVRDYEPRAALVSGQDGLTTIRRLLNEARTFLEVGGHFVFEIGSGQSTAVKQLIDSRMWDLLAIHEDLQRIPRAVVLKKK